MELGRLRHLLADAAGLVFEDSRRDSLSYSVAERLRLTGIADVASYLDAVSVPGAPERQRLLDEVTIQETHFFRNPPQIRALRKHVIPKLLKHADTHGRRLRIWSAGCSTGEEPYTIAMILRELLPTRGFMLKAYPGAAGQRLGLARAHLRRWRGLVAALPAAIRAVRAAKRRP